MRLLLVFDLNDVEAKIALHQVAHLSFIHGKRGIFKRRNHLAPHDPIQFSPLGLASGIIGVLLRQVGEIGAIFQLFQDIFSLGLGRVYDFWVRSRRCLDQDMAHFDPFGCLVILLVVAIVLLQVSGRNGRSASSGLTAFLLRSVFVNSGGGALRSRGHGEEGR